MSMTIIAPALVIGGVTLFLAICAAMWKLGRWVGTIDSDLNGIKAILGRMEVGLDELSRTVQALSGRLDELSRTVQALSGRFHRLTGAAEGTITATESPLKLNDLGRKLSKEFGGKAWAKAQADSIRDQVVGKQPYDVQEFCYGYVTEDKLTGDELKRAKDIAYGNGTPLWNVLHALAYELRDSLLASGRG